MDTANDKRGEAMRAVSDGDNDAALAAFQQAIELNPQMAVLYAKRAQYVSPPLFACHPLLVLCYPGPVPDVS